MKVNKKKSAAILAAMTVLGIIGTPVWADAKEVPATGKDVQKDGDLDEAYASLNALIRTHAELAVENKATAAAAQAQEAQVYEAPAAVTAPTGQHTIYNEDGFYAKQAGGNTYNSLTKDGLWVGGTSDTTGFRVDKDGNVNTTGNAAIDGTATVGGAATFKGDATFEKGASMNGQKITNVADGTEAADAVNLDQLQKAAAKATTEVTEGKNVTVTKTAAADGHNIYNVALKDDIDVDTVNTTGNATIGGTADITGKLTAKGGAAVTGGLTADTATVTGAVKAGTVTVAGEVKSSSANIGGVEIGGGNINAATATITNLGVENNIYAKLGTIGGVGLEGGNVAATTGTIGGVRIENEGVIAHGVLAKQIVADAAEFGDVEASTVTADSANIGGVGIADGKVGGVTLKDGNISTGHFYANAAGTFGNDKFKVFEDGAFSAADRAFLVKNDGSVTATAGNIGAVTLADGNVTANVIRTKNIQASSGTIGNLYANYSVIGNVEIGSGNSSAINVGNGKFVVYDGGSFTAAGREFIVKDDGSVEAKAGITTPKVTGLAEGTADSDAVNVSQLNKANANIGDLQYDTDHYVTKGDSLTTAVGKLDTQVYNNTTEIDKFHGAGIIAGNVDADTSGNPANNSIALGQGSNVGANYRAVALGTYSKVAESLEGTALGANSSVTGVNGAVALGQGSTVTRSDITDWGADGAHGVVSVGKSGTNGFTRRIINVKAGTEDTDAVNVKQLTDTVDTATEGVVKWDKTGDTYGNTINGVGFAGNGALTANSIVLSQNSAENSDYGVNITTGGITIRNGGFRLNDVGISGNDLNIYDHETGNVTTSVDLKKAAQTVGTIVKVGEAVWNYPGVADAAKTAAKDIALRTLNPTDTLSSLSQKFGAKDTTDLFHKLGEDNVNKILSQVQPGAKWSEATGKVTLGGLELPLTTVEKISLGIAGATGTIKPVDLIRKAPDILEATSNHIDWAAINADKANGLNELSKGHVVGTTADIGGVSISAKDKDNLSKISGVADGVDAHDAATVGQLNTVGDGVTSLNLKIGTGDFSGTNYVQTGSDTTITQAIYDVDAQVKVNADALDTLHGAGILAGTSGKDTSIAIGKGSNADGAHTVVLGQGSSSKGEGGTIIGQGINSTYKGATAVGQGIAISGDYATAIGNGASAGKNGVALGAGSVAAADTVSVGSVGKERKITNVADGVDAHDAATVGQVNTTLDGYVAYAKNGDAVNKDLVKFGGGENGTTLQNVGDITMQVPFQDKTQGYKAVYQERSFQKAGLMPGEVVFDDNFKADPNNKLVKGNVVAIGHNAKSYNSSGSTVVGEFSNIDNSNWTTALGAGVTVNNSEQSVSIGNGSTLTDSTASVAIGQNSKVWKSDWSQAIGVGANIYGDAKNSAKYTNNIALGTYSSVESANGSVALGSSSKVNGQDNVVSVGSTSLKRKIINVAKGTDDNDAVNYAQLKEVTGNVTGLTTIVGDGKYTSKNYIVDGDTLTAAASKLDTKVKANADEIDTLHGAGIVAGTFANGSSHSISMGEGAQADKGNSTAIGYKAHSGEKGIAIGSNANKNSTARQGGITIGADASTMGLYSTVVGTGTEVGAGSAQATISLLGGMMKRDVLVQGAASTVIGAQNSMSTTKDNDRAFTSVGNSVIGAANKVEDSNGVAIQGSGNTVKNAYKDLDMNKVDAWGIIGGDYSSLMDQETGSVAIIGGANTVEDSTGISNIGFANTLKDSDHIFTAGTHNTITNVKSSVVIGDDVAVSDVTGVISLGDKNKVTADNAVALGQGASVSAANSVALGAGSVADREDSVSIGNRYLTNVKAGEKETDAVNKAQLDAVTKGFSDAGINAGTANSGNIAIGTGSKATGDTTLYGAVAIGTNASITWDKTVNPVDEGYGWGMLAMGDGAKVENSFFGVMIGAKGTIEKSNYGVALGGANDIVNSFGGVGIGNNADVTNAAYGVAIGLGSSVQSNARLAVSLGAGSVATEANTISVGRSKADAEAYNKYIDEYNAKMEELHPGDDNYKLKKVSVDSDLFRRVTNVADGNIAIGSHDAVTGGQLAAAGIIPGIFGDDKTATAGALDNVQIGNGSRIDDNSIRDSVVIGKGAYLGKSSYGAVTIGKDSAIGANSMYAMAIGRGSSIGDWAGNSMALGTGAKVESGDAYNHITNAVALGADSIANVANTVSFGNDTLKRRLTNVAAGTEDTDAVNKKQLTDTVNNSITASYDQLKKDLTNISTGAVDLATLTGAGIKGGTADAGNTALGVGSKATGEKLYGAVAIGNNASITWDAKNDPQSVKPDGWGMVAIGDGATVTDSFFSELVGAKGVIKNSRYASAFGGFNNIDNSYAGTSLGNSANLKDAYAGTALGATSKVLGAKNAVALGAGSVAAQDTAISVGRSADDVKAYNAYVDDFNAKMEAEHPGDDNYKLKKLDETDTMYRRITSVAAGTGANDAVIVSQFNGKGGAGDASFLSAVGKIDWKTVGDKADAINTAIGKLKDDGTISTTAVTKSLANAKFSLLSTVQPTMLAADETAATDEKRSPTAGSTSEADASNSARDPVDGVTTEAGKVSVDRDLDVAGSATVGKDLTVKSNSTFEGTAKFQKGADMGGNKVTSVADGDVSEKSTDAINGSQLYTEQQDRIAGDNALGGRIDTLSGQVNKLGGEIDSVGAISAALAGLHPLDYNPANSKYQLAAAFGGYDGSYALALGGFYNVNQDILLSGGVSTILKGERKTAGNVGVTFRVGAGNSAKDLGTPADMKEANQQLAALKQDNKVLAGENRKLAEKVESQDQKIAELEAKFEELLKKVK